MPPWLYAIFPVNISAILFPSKYLSLWHYLGFLFYLKNSFSTFLLLNCMSQSIKAVFFLLCSLCITALAELSSESGIKEALHKCLWNEGPKHPSSWAVYTLGDGISGGRISEVCAWTTEFPYNFNFWNQKSFEIGSNSKLGDRMIMPLWVSGRGISIQALGRCI